MVYDLNVPWSSTSSDLEQTISFLSNLGYNTLALNNHISTVPSQISNPIPTEFSFTVPPKVVLLRRCTLSLADPSQNHRLPALSSAYDILALRPTTEKAFDAACLKLTEHSIISVDLTQRFPFFFKLKTCMTAVNRGIKFELCYAAATMTNDASARRNCISNCMGIMRATKGRGLIVSSGATSVLAVRAPADVLNLLGVWGLARERGTESLGVNPRGVVVNEGLKRSSFRGVIDVVYGGKKEVLSEKERPQDIDGNLAKGKRKVEENRAIHENTAPQMSKRQAKRMKLEALKAEKETSSSSISRATSQDAQIMELDTHCSIRSVANA